jgi:hypothetical protein
MKKVILHLDKPNKNGRTYTTKAVQHALAECPRPLLIQRKQEDMGVPIPTNTVGEASLCVEDNTVVALCRFTHPDWAELVSAGKLGVVTSGTGSVVDGVVQQDYRITYLFLTNAPAL